MNSARFPDIMMVFVGQVKLVSCPFDQFLIFSEDVSEDLKSNSTHKMQTTYVNVCTILTMFFRKCQSTST
jgi:hypothetical protein